MFKIECAACHAKWQTPGMWNERFTVPSYLHGECPKCGNWKHNTGFEVKEQNDDTTNCR